MVVCRLEYIFFALESYKLIIFFVIIYFNFSEMNIYKFESKFIVYESGKYIFQLNKLIMYISRYVDFDTIDTDTLMDSLVDIIIDNNDINDNIDKYVYVNDELDIVEFKLINEDYIQKIYRFFKHEFKSCI